MISIFSSILSLLVTTLSVLQHVPGCKIIPEHLMKYNRHGTNFCVYGKIDLMRLLLRVLLPSTDAECQGSRTIGLVCLVLRDEIVDLFQFYARYFRYLTKIKAMVPV